MCRAKNHGQVTLECVWMREREREWGKRSGIINGLQLYWHPPKNRENKNTYRCCCCCWVYQIHKLSLHLDVACSFCRAHIMFNVCVMLNKGCCNCNTVKSLRQNSLDVLRILWMYLNVCMHYCWTICGSKILFFSLLFHDNNTLKMSNNGENNVQKCVWMRVPCLL